MGFPPDTHILTHVILFVNARNKYFYICVPSLATLSPVVIIPAVVHILANRRLKKPVSRLNTGSTKKNPVNVKFTGFFLYKIRTLPRVLKIFYL